MNIKRKSRGFTLVELLIVIAIIGVLASMTIPAVSKGMDYVNRLEAGNNAGSIAKTWLSYVKTGSRVRSVKGDNIYTWASVLAREGLNDPEIWILDFDPVVQDFMGVDQTMPIAVANKSSNNQWRVNPEFKAFPISFEVANKMPSNASVKTPLVWTRGLNERGYWDKNIGVFKDAGGQIAFVDGHVSWYASLRDENNSQKGILTVFDGTSRTYNIAKAINGGKKNILKSKVGLDTADADDESESEE